MLVITRKESDSILIGDNIEVIVSEIGAERVKIAIRAPKGIPIMRRELVETENMNREANAASGTQALGKLKDLLKRQSPDEKPLNFSKKR